MRGSGKRTGHPFVSHFQKKSISLLKNTWVFSNHYYRQLHHQSMKCESMLTQSMIRFSPYLVRISLKSVFILSILSLHQAISVWVGAFAQSVFSTFHRVVPIMLSLRLNYHKCIVLRNAMKVALYSQRLRTQNCKHKF